jgi:hypothetical protein
MRIMPSIDVRVGLTLLALSLFSVSGARAQSPGVGERAQGMAGAFVAVADDASAVYWNPGGLAWPSGSTFDAQVSVADPGAFVGAALPSLGLSYYRLPTVSASANRQKEGSGEVPVRPLTTTNIGVTINQTVVNTLVIGSTIRLVHGGFEGRDGRTTVDIDAGAMFSAGNFRAGLVARNLGQPAFEAETGSFELERQVRAGVAFAPRSLPTGVHGPFTAAFDVDLNATAGVDGERRGAALGSEYWLGHGLVGVRAGAQWSTINDPNVAFSGGITVRLPHSVFLEGHLTNSDLPDADTWGVGARFTF